MILEKVIDFLLMEEGIPPPRIITPPEAHKPRAKKPTLFKGAIRYRCPYCKHGIDDTNYTVCPNCKRVVREPEQIVFRAVPGYEMPAGMVLPGKEPKVQIGPKGGLFKIVPKKYGLR